MNENRIILSVDVEDWQQSTWDRNLPIRQRAADNTIKLLDLLDAYNVKATMFILGKFSKRFPDIVKEISRRGHEVACHGYGHQEIFLQDSRSFRRDVEQAKDDLEQIISKPVVGYRAPDFSIIYSSLWALEVLAELGFQYDSSIFPIKHSRYGIPSWPMGIRNVILNSGRSILEFPLSVFKVVNRKIPVSGGGYFRLLPFQLFSLFMSNILTKRPFIFYMHPYELDYKEFDSLEFEVPYSTRIHQGLGRKYFTTKLRYLLNKGEFETFSDSIRNRSTPYPDYGISSLHI